VTPARGSRFVGQGPQIGAKMGCQHQCVLRASKRRMGHGNVGPRRRRGRGTLERGGASENCRPRLETLKPKGEGPTAPMPMPVRGGQRGGVDGDEKGLTCMRSLFVMGSH